MRKFKTILFFLLGITRRRSYYNALKLARYYRKKYFDLISDDERRASEIAEGLSRALRKRGFDAIVADGGQHKIESLYKSDDFELRHCVICNNRTIFLETKSNITDDLIIILESIHGVDEIQRTATPKICIVEVVKDFDKKEVALKIGNKIKEYILI